MNKEFKSYQDQIHYLHDTKNIVSNEKDKTILVRNGYFNLINGYKQPFITGETPDGNHIYLSGTTLNQLLHVKNFDEQLRDHLMKYITKVEQEIRQTFAYKFDELTQEHSLFWDDERAFDNKQNHTRIEENINKIKVELDQSKQGYIVHYRDKHEFIPTWIMLKYVKFSIMIDFIKYSNPIIKADFCNLYNIEIAPRKKDFDKEYDFRVLNSSLQWMRKVRNACAHNERIYGLVNENKRTITRYHKVLGKKYNSRDQKIIDLFIFIKYFLPHDEYVEFITFIYKLIIDLEHKINPIAFSRVKKTMGISKVNDLMTLLKNPNMIEYEKY